MQNIIPFVRCVVGSFILGLAGARGSEGLLPCIQRGPYLLSPTGTSTVLRLRTSEPMAITVFYGEASDNISLSKVSTDLSVDHQVLLDGLTGGTRYFYTIVDEQGKVLNT